MQTSSAYLQYYKPNKLAQIDDSDRFTWVYHDGTGFRLDYAFVSPHLSSILKEVSAFHDHELRKSKIYQIIQH